MLLYINLMILYEFLYLCQNGDFVASLWFSLNKLLEHFGSIKIIFLLDLYCRKKLSLIYVCLRLSSPKMEVLGPLFLILWVAKVGLLATAQTIHIFII